MRWDLLSRYMDFQGDFAKPFLSLGKNITLSLDIA